MKKLLISVMLIMFSFSVISQITTTGDGDWDITTTWNGGILPTQSDDVTIGNTHVITINVADSFRISDLWLSNVCTINVYGILVMDSLHINNNATLNVSGTVTILGGASLANNTTLTVNNTGSVDITGDVTTGNGSDLVVDGNLSIGGDLSGSATVSGTGTVSVTGTVEGTITDLGPLPIELTTFKAYKSTNNITIFWQTATEENNDYFTIERSADGLIYEIIGSITGAGNSSTSNDYSYIDNNPLSGVSYYRLTQTDYNGDFEIFSPISVSYINNKSIYIGPNPAINQLNISFYGELGTGEVDVFNMIGARVKSVNIVENQTKIDVSNLPSGSYLVVFSAKETKTTKRIIIQ